MSASIAPARPAAGAIAAGDAASRRSLVILLVAHALASLLPQEMATGVEAHARRGGDSVELDLDVGWPHRLHGSPEPRPPQTRDATPVGS
jgi:hypothetical protein